MQLLRQKVWWKSGKNGFSVSKSISASIAEAILRQLPKGIKIVMLYCAIFTRRQLTFEYGNGCHYLQTTKSWKSEDICINKVSLCWNAYLSKYLMRLKQKIQIIDIQQRRLLPARRHTLLHTSEQKCRSFLCAKMSVYSLQNSCFCAGERFAKLKICPCSRWLTSYS